MKTTIEMAREAGFEVDEDIANVWVSDAYIGDKLERLAALARADEREAVVQLIKELRPAIRPLEVMGKPMTTEEWFDVLVEDIRARGNT